MRHPSALLLLPVFAGLALIASARASGPALEAPVVVDAGPISSPTDVASEGYRRVTFSPNGDGHDDAVTIRVRAAPGHALSLSVRPASRSPVYVHLPTAGAGITVVHWSGMQTPGRRFPDGSYVLHVCDTVTHRCSAGGVIAHLRLISMYVRRATGVSSGETLKVHISADGPGPYTLDLVSAADPAGAGIGKTEIPRAGVVAYRVPRVPAGGLWLLRVRGDSAITSFPLVVHQPGFGLDDPLPHTALVIYPYLTWRAYDMFDENRDGIVDSWYAHPRNPVVPLYGPFEPWTLEPALQGREANPTSQDAFAQWMEGHDLTAQHVTDVELGSLPQAVLDRYAEIVFEGHTEYYELRTYDKVLAYRNAGGRLYFLQGNPFYGRAQIVGDHVWRRSYRYRTASRSDFALAGVGFRECCWPRTVRPVYHLAPDAVERLPWAFAGTGLTDGDPFGIANGEVDTIDPRLSPPGTFAVATATVPPFKPTSEKETEGWLGSKPIPYAPAYLKPQQIDIAYARAGKGEVFSWGNTGFMKSVRFRDQGVPDDERAELDRVALNVWKHFTR